MSPESRKWFAAGWRQAFQSMFDPRHPYISYRYRRATRASLARTL